MHKIWLKCNVLLTSTFLSNCKRTLARLDSFNICLCTFPQPCILLIYLIIQIKNYHSDIEKSRQAEAVYTHGGQHSALQQPYFIGQKYTNVSDTQWWTRNISSQ